MKQEITILKNRPSNRINEYLPRDINLQIVIFLLFITMCPMNLLAQSYVQTRIGYVTGRFRPLDKNLLNRDEHDFIGGFMVDTEIGRRFGNNRFALLMGGRLQ